MWNSRKDEERRVMFNTGTHKLTCEFKQNGKWYSLIGNAGGAAFDIIRSKEEWKLLQLWRKYEI